MQYDNGTFPLNDISFESLVCSLIYVVVITNIMSSVLLVAKTPQLITSPEKDFFIPWFAKEKSHDTNLFAC
jgi:hypothetical protein